MYGPEVRIPPNPPRLENGEFGSLMVAQVRTPVATYARGRPIRERRRLQDAYHATRGPAW